MVRYSVQGVNSICSQKA